VADDREIVGRMAGAYPAGVLVEGDIHDPVELMLDPPVAAGGGGKCRHRERGTQKIVVTFGRGDVPALALALDQADGGEVGPGPGRIEVRQERGVAEDPVLAGFPPPVVLFDRLQVLIGTRWRI